MGDRTFSIRISENGVILQTSFAQVKPDCDACWSDNDVIESGVTNLFWDKD